MEPGYTNHTIDEFEEAAAFVVSAYKILRRLAGEAIVRRVQMEAKMETIEQLVVQIRVSDDIDYIRRVARAIEDVLGS